MRARPNQRVTSNAIFASKQPRSLWLHHVDTFFAGPVYASGSPGDRNALCARPFAKKRTSFPYMAKEIRSQRIKAVIYQRDPKVSVHQQRLTSRDRAPSSTTCISGSLGSRSLASPSATSVQWVFLTTRTFRKVQSWRRGRYEVECSCVLDSSSWPGSCSSAANLS